MDHLNLTQNETLNSLEFETDYFRSLYESRISKWVFVSAVIMLLPINIMLLYSVTWYEHFGSDQKRTLINKFVSSICWTGMEFAIVVQGVNITRFCLGPLPPLLCLFKAVVLTSVAMQLLLFADAIMISRYLFIFVLKNPFAVEDDFWSCFANIWIMSFACLSQSLFYYLPGRQPLEYYLCIGADPALAPDEIKINFAMFGVYFLTVIVNLVIPIKIRLYKAKYNKSHDNKEYEQQTLTDLTTSISFVALVSICIGSLASAYQVNPVTLHKSPRYIAVFLVYFTQLGTPNLVSCFAMLVYFCRNKPLRSFIFRRLKDAFQPESCT